MSQVMGGPDEKGLSVDPNKKRIAPFSGSEKEYPGFVDDVSEHLGNLGPIYRDIFLGNDVVASAQPIIKH